MKLTPEQEKALFDALAERWGAQWATDMIEHESDVAPFACCVGYLLGFEAAREAAAALLALSNEQLKLMAGEMTAQEVRTTQAVLKSRAAAITAIQPQETP